MGYFSLQIHCKRVNRLKKDIMLQSNEQRAASEKRQIKELQIKRYPHSLN